MWRWRQTLPSRNGACGRRKNGSAFPIYLLHLFFNETLTSLIPWLAPEAFPGSVANYLGVWALAAAASICVAQALRRWAPRTAGVLFGGR